MTDKQDQLDPGDSDPVATPMDAANQSLSEALRASFVVLKALMAFLVVLYLFSNVRTIENHEQAIVLRMGELRPTVYEAGLVWAFPFPIDEVVPLPTKRSNEMLIDSHTFHRSENEIGQELAMIFRGPTQPLNPTLDGALLTADAGLVHVQWKVTYKFDDVAAFVKGIYGDGTEAAETLIKTLVETVGIEVATEFKAEELIRTKTEDVRREMKRRINLRLTGLHSGVQVTQIQMHEPTPPLQVRRAFDETQRAAANKEQKRRQAEREATELLSEAAGAVHPALRTLLQAVDRAADDPDALAKLRVELDEMLETRVEGEAGRRIREAGAYQAQVVQQMNADIDRYRMLLPEYKRNPSTLINRLWEETKLAILSSPGVKKIYRPAGLERFVLRIPLDPQQRRIDRIQTLQGATFDPGQLIPEHLVPVGPAFD